MIRSVLFAAGALGLALPLVPSPASAHPPRPVPFPQVRPVVVQRPVPSIFVPPPPARPVCRAWKVEYHVCHRDPWQCYGVFEEYRDARCAARDLRRAGYKVDIDYARH
jgi:hypothetical protein